MITTAGVAKAAWSTDLSQNLLISEEGRVFQDLAMCKSTPQGNVWVSWISWEDENAFLKVQLLDGEGNAMLEPGGKYISKNPTPTWSSGYALDVTAEGDAVLAYCDKRNGVWQAYLYKVDSSGKLLWGDAGVAVLTGSQETCLNPQLCVTPAGNAYVGFQCMEGAKNITRIFKFNSEGDHAWGGSITVDRTNGIFNLIPTGADSVMAAYFTTSGNYEVMKYTANGEEAWGAPKPIDDSGTVSITAEPNIVADGEGGFLAGWRNNISQFSYIGLAQHLNADGKKMWGEDVITYDLPWVAVSPDGGACIASREGADGSQTLSICRISKEGTQEWYNHIEALEAYKLTLYALLATPSKVTAVYRDASDYNQAIIGYTELSPEGELLRLEGVVSDAPGDKGRGGVAEIPGRLVVVWGDNGSSKGKGFVFAQDIPYDNTGIGDIMKDADANAKIIVTSIDGKTVCVAPEIGQRLEGGIYVISEIRGKNIKTKKVIIKP